MSTIDIKNVISPSYQLYINGTWTDGTSTEKVISYNPSNGEKLSEFVEATHKDVDHAVAAAQEAFKSWKNVDVVERSRLLLTIADLIDENTERLGLIETLDNGKPLRETVEVDIPEAADHFRYFAAVIRAEEDSLKVFNPNTLSLAIREPIGVVGQVVPWNYPILMAMWKIAPALAAGNTIVIHPSSSTSLSLLEFAKIIDPVLPAGVFNIITGHGSQSGNYLLNHIGIDKLAFTGSTEVGYLVAEAAAKRLIPATLELGGKSANIVFEDANIEKALEGTTLGILFNQGQVCCAGSRLLLQDTIFDDFIAQLKTKFEGIKVGLPWEKDTQMGAQINEKQIETIQKYVDIGIKEGATLVTGGERLGGDLSRGCFFKPTILLGNNDMCIAQEEIFGPVLTVVKFSTENEAIALANDSEYGLAGGVYTRDLNRALRVSRAVETGTMWVNTFGESPAGVPFGGYKKSGIGREVHKMVLNAYTQTKNIYIVTDEETGGWY